MLAPTIDRPVEDYSIAPPLDAWVQSELARLFGLNRFDEPNMKIVWGGSERERKPDGRWGLKYKLPGKKFVTNAPVKIGSLFLVTKQPIEWGRPRWIIERFMPPERLDLSGRQLYPRGRYVFYYEVEDTHGFYRAPGRDTIEWVRELMSTQDERDRELDRYLQKEIEDERDAPVDEVDTPDYMTPEIYQEI